MDKQQKMLTDLAICMRDGIKLDTLLEDINEAEGTEDDYGYSSGELEEYLNTLNNRLN